MACGEILSIREVPVPPKQVGQPGPRTESRAAQSDLQQSVPVGAVVSLPFGNGDASYGGRFGAAETPEMQARLEQSSYEIIVLMASGERRSLLRSDGARFFVGQRVALREGGLEPR